MPCIEFPVIFNNSSSTRDVKVGMIQFSYSFSSPRGVIFSYIRCDFLTWTKEIVGRYNLGNILCQRLPKYVIFLSGFIISFMPCKMENLFENGIRLYCFKQRWRAKCIWIVEFNLVWWNVGKRGKWFFLWGYCTCIYKMDELTKSPRAKSVYEIYFFSPPRIVPWETRYPRPVVLVNYMYLWVTRVSMKLKHCLWTLNT